MNTIIKIAVAVNVLIVLAIVYFCFMAERKAPAPGTEFKGCPCSGGGIDPIHFML